MAEMTKKRVEGDMSCDAGFLVLPECLGQSYESRAACFPSPYDCLASILACMRTT